MNWNDIQQDRVKGKREKEKELFLISEDQTGK